MGKEGEVFPSKEIFPAEMNYPRKGPNPDFTSWSFHWLRPSDRTFVFRLNFLGTFIQCPVYHTSLHLFIYLFIYLLFKWTTSWHFIFAKINSESSSSVNIAANWPWDSKRSTGRGQGLFSGQIVSFQTEGVWKVKTHTASRTVPLGFPLLLFWAALSQPLVWSQLDQWVSKSHARKR